MQIDLLKQLRDIHYPPPISIWPLAMGWYIVMAILFISLIVAGYLWFRKIKNSRLKKIVLMRLAALQQQQCEKNNVAEELSMLLRRCALAIYPRHEVAGLVGEKWLEFLDQTSMTKEFTEGPGRILVVSPYKGEEKPLPEQLFHLVNNWVKKNL